MKLIENKLPIILASSSGAIIHFSKSAMLITGGISLGESICNITNEDIVMKYSMYNRNKNSISPDSPRQNKRKGSRQNNFPNAFGK